MVRDIQDVLSQSIMWNQNFASTILSILLLKMKIVAVDSAIDVLSTIYNLISKPVDFLPFFIYCLCCYSFFIMGYLFRYITFKSSILDGKPSNNDDIAMATAVVVQPLDEPDIITYAKPTVVTSNHMAQSVPIIRTTETTTSRFPVSQSVPLYSTPPLKSPPAVEDPIKVENPNPYPYPLSILRLGRDPCRIDCPSCHKDIFTNTRCRTDAITWIVFIVLLIMIWPLCWLPFVLPSCQSVDHICPSCRRIISTTRACE